jgi:hypothetical protein
MEKFWYYFVMALLFIATLILFVICSPILIIDKIKGYKSK